MSKVKETRGRNIPNYREKFKKTNDLNFFPFFFRSKYGFKIDVLNGENSI